MDNIYLFLMVFVIYFFNRADFERPTLLIGVPKDFIPPPPPSLRPPPRSFGLEEAAVVATPVVFLTPVDNDVVDVVLVVLVFLIPESPTFLTPVDDGNDTPVDFVVVVVVVDLVVFEAPDFVVVVVFVVEVFFLAVDFFFFSSSSS